MLYQSNIITSASATQGGHNKQKHRNTEQTNTSTLRTSKTKNYSDEIQLNMCTDLFAQVNNLLRDEVFALHNMARRVGSPTAPQTWQRNC